MMRSMTPRLDPLAGDPPRPAPLPDDQWDERTRAALAGPRPANRRDAAAGNALGIAAPVPEHER